ncbi:hypothetical protein BJX68DRAFT_240205 [Aspergillus pseudodeflectus]|uniref:Uncharacterized protein n=1 Tax=Aspergillus pseudodeflectus TaxID=176178 RepID=A0ABR4K433_9EURO
MDPATKYLDPPPPYEDAVAEGSHTKIPTLQPVTLLLDGQCIRDASTSTSRYQISRSVTTLPKTPPKNSSIIFERVDTASRVLEKDETPGTEQAPSEPRHLFYLAHPADAQYRADVPGYYITAVATETAGNIHLETSKSRLQKLEFTALLSAKRTASDRPLFDEAGKTVTLFSARPAKLMSSRYTWTQEDGSQIAVEDGKGDEHRLAITTAMTQEMRDALVAVWLLRLWYETAESKQAKREELERLAAPVSYQDWTYAKRVGGLGALAGAGGG